MHFEQAMQSLAERATASRMSGSGWLFSLIRASIAGSVARQHRAQAAEETTSGYEPKRENHQLLRRFGKIEALDSLAKAKDRPRSYLTNEAITNYIDLHAYQDALVSLSAEEKTHHLDKPSSR